MNTKAFNTFDVYSEIVVIGSNQDNADYTNPRGEYYGFAAYVRASNEFGDTRLFYVATDSNEAEAIRKAEQQAAALQVRVDKLGKLPVGFDSWETGRAVYGSDAYEAYGREDDLAWEAEEA